MPAQVDDLEVLWTRRGITDRHNMSQLQIQHALQHYSGLAADRAVNTWYVDTNATELTYVDSIIALNKAFYDDIAQYISKAWMGPGSTVKVYQLLDPIPRVPVATDFRATEIPSAGAQPMPDEVACCLSYSAGAVSGVPNARRRGRLYLGPLNVSAVSATGNESPRPAAAFKTAVLDAAVEWNNALEALACSWVQYSPTAQLVTNVANCWVDDAFDTQRRRGVAPTVKTARIL